MDKHLVAFLHDNSNMTLSWLRWVTLVRDGLDLSPDLGSYIILEQVVKTDTVATSSKD